MSDGVSVFEIRLADFGEGNAPPGKPGSELSAERQAECVSRYKSHVAGRFMEAAALEMRDATGEFFRKCVLAPLLDNYERIEIDLEDVFLEEPHLLDSSWMDEVFCGLVRENGLSPEEIASRVKFTGPEAERINKIALGYARAAASANENAPLKAKLAEVPAHACAAS